MTPDFRAFLLSKIHSSFSVLFYFEICPFSSVGTWQPGATAKDKEYLPAAKSLTLAFKENADEFSLLA